MIQYEVIRSDRRTLVICITKDAKVKVRCNYKTKDTAIKEFVRSKEAWIKKHLDNISKQTLKPLEYGSYVLYLGTEYKIFSTNKESYFDTTAFYINENSNIYKELEAFYKNKAKEILPEMVHKKESSMGLYAAGIKITSASARWGSCSGKNNLNFPWRLMMAGPEVINYVIVHELAHIKEKNHGIKFWQLVEKFEPDYKIKQEQLRMLEKRIRQECWH